MTLSEQSGPKDNVVRTESRRGALTTMLAGSALGLAALTTQGADAKKNGKGKGKGKGKKNGKHKGGNGRARSNNGNGNGRGNGHGSLPSVQFISEETTIDQDGVFSGVARCPEGYLPISGGFDSTLDDLVLLSSAPGPGERDWTVEIDNAVDGETLTVFAVCLEANDDTPEDESNNGSRGRRRRGKRR